MSDKACKNCRHHRKDPRRKAEGVADGDLEIVEFADEAVVMYVCLHDDRGVDKEVGLEGAEPAPGTGCELFEVGSKGGISPELERLVARSEDR